MEAIIIVINRGADALLDLDCREASHISQMEEGWFAGCYPTGQLED
jgi:hypothetical protein